MEGIMKGETFWISVLLEGDRLDNEHDADEDSYCYHATEKDALKHVKEELEQDVGTHYVILEAKAVVAVTKEIKVETIPND